jgi:hypothetical protein
MQRSVGGRVGHRDSRALRRGVGDGLEVHCGWLSIAAIGSVLAMRDGITVESYCILAFFAQSIKLRSIFCKLSSEVLDAVESLLLFLGN